MYKDSTTKELSVLARQDRVSIMLETAIKERFHYYAESMGLTDSALGAFLVGQWVFQQDRVNGPVLEAIKTQMTEVLGKEIQSMKDLVAGGEFGEMQADQEENQSSGIVWEGKPAHVEQGGVAPKSL